MQKSALDQAAAIRAGVLSPAELIDSTREKMTALNPALNAITWTRFEAAKQDANQLEDHGQPFFGMPLVKVMYRNLVLKTSQMQNFMVPPATRGTTTIRQVALPVAQQRLWLQVLVRWQPVLMVAVRFAFPLLFPA